MPPTPNAPARTHDLALTPYYRATFEVAPRDPQEHTDVLWSVLASVRNWLGHDPAQLAGQSLPDEPRAWSALKVGGTMASDDGTASITSASRHLDDGELLWACEVRRVQRDPGHATRVWLTELGLHRHSPTAMPDAATATTSTATTSAPTSTLTVLATHADRQGFLGPKQPAPPKRAPGIVSSILGNRHIRCTVDGLPATLRATELAFHDLPDWWSYLMDPERTAPVVLVSPKLPPHGNPIMPIDPDQLAATTGPCAMVFYSLDPGFHDMLPYIADERGLGCDDGAIRLYTPHPNKDDPADARRHRYLGPRAIQAMGAQAAMESVAEAIATNLWGLADVPRVRTIHDLRRKDALEQSAEESLRSTEEEALRWLREAEADLDAVQYKNAALRSERDELRATNHSLRVTVASLRRSASGDATATTRPSAPPLPEPDRWPPTPAYVARIFVAAHPTRLDFTDRGWKSLDACTTSPDVVWNALNDLCLVAWELHASGVPDVQRAFNEQSSFAYARGMGRMTRRDRQALRAYSDTYQGHPIQCEAHIGRGNNDTDPSSVRVYFCFDPPTGKIVISHVGNHLPSHLSRGIA